MSDEAKPEPIRALPDGWWCSKIQVDGAEVIFRGTAPPAYEIVGASWFLGPEPGKKSLILVVREVGR